MYICFTKAKNMKVEIQPILTFFRVVAVADRLPAENKSLVFILDKSGEGIAYFKIDDHSFRDNVTDEKLSGVTHWLERVNIDHYKTNSDAIAGATNQFIDRLGACSGLHIIQNTSMHVITFAEKSQSNETYSVCVSNGEI